MVRITHIFLFLAVVSVFLSAASASGTSLLQQNENQTEMNACSYTIYVQTGDVKSAGTDSKISVTVADKNGRSFTVPNLVGWGGQMGPRHDYFERGHLDRFQGTAPCIGPQICQITVVSDGKGNKPGWYLQSVTVRRTNSGSSYTFNINEWLQPGHWSTTKSICPKSSSCIDDKNVIESVVTVV